jgi:hypothetical protein
VTCGSLETEIGYGENCADIFILESKGHVHLILCQYSQSLQNTVQKLTIGPNFSNYLSAGLQIERADSVGGQVHTTPLPRHTVSLVRGEQPTVDLSSGINGIHVQHIRGKLVPIERSR